jgi:hypothetical protein
MAVASDSLITVEDYKSWKGIENSMIERDAISLYCSAGDATAATVTKSGDTLTLVITGGTSAGTNALDLTAAANDTLGELAAVIEALAGWTATLIGWSSADSTDLKNLASTSVLGSSLEKTLIFYDNYIIERMIDMASDVIENYLNRKIKTATYTNERYDGGKDMVFLEQYPVTAVTQVCNGYEDPIRIKNTSGKFNAYAIVSATGVALNVDGTPVAEKTFASYATMALLAAALNAESGWEASCPTSAYNDWPSSLLFVQPNVFCLDMYGYLQCPSDPLEDYTFDLRDGIVYLPGGFAGGYKDVFVTYVAGYSTVPDDIIYGVCKFVGWMDDGREEDESMKGEKLGDYNYTRADLEEALSVSEIKALRKHRRPLI